MNAKQQPILFIIVNSAIETDLGRDGQENILRAAV